MKLAPLGTLKQGVDDLVEKHMQKINQQNRNPSTVVSIRDFVETVYLPFVQAQLRPSTYKGYENQWRNHLAARCGDVLLRNVRTCDVARWLKEIGLQDKHAETGEPLRHTSLQRLKALLSAIFAHAKCQGYYDGVNPVQDAAIPPAPRGAETHAYSLAEIRAMLAVIVDRTASAIVTVAAYTGLRKGEIAGLRWEDWRDGALWVTRSKWNAHLLEPKTRASAAPVPMIGTLARTLTAYRAHVGSPQSGPMFPSRTDTAIDLTNVLNRHILPRLKAAGIEWHGWHAFRRGLATNLHDQGVPDKTIQAILRHSNIAVTMACYVKSLPQQSVDAMAQLENALACADRALDSTTDDATLRVN